MFSGWQCGTVGDVQMKTLDADIRLEVAELAASSVNVALNSNMIFALLEYVTRLERVVEVVEKLEIDDAKLTNEMERLDMALTIVNKSKVIK